MSSVASSPAPFAARQHLLARLVCRPVALFSLVVLSVVAVVAALGGRIAPYDPNEANISLVLATPSAEHVLGNDSAGRDVLSRLLAATQISIAAALVAIVTALILGVVAGLIAGYYRGWFDTVASWGTAVVMALPGIVVLLAVRAVVGSSIWLAMVVFGLLISPAYYKLVHSSVTAVRQELYIDAARVSGLGSLRIIARHVLSVVRAPIIMQSAIVAGMTIAVQAGLEFLGLGDLNVPTWGQMLNDAFVNIYRAPHLMLWPSLAIALTSIALTLLANAMRDELERSTPVGRRRRRKAAQADVVDSAPAPQVIVHADDAATAAIADERLLEISGLRVAYDQPDGSSIEVVHGVSMAIRRGEVHGLIGESGSGKSQTAFSVLGLLPRGGRVTAGTIDFDGTALAGGSEKAYAPIRGTRIGYIPQEPMSNLDPSFTIGHQLVEPLRVGLGMSKAEAKAKALALLARVGIPDPQRTFDAYPFEVSGGMAQRVLIAGAVSTDPDLIIADEPTTALDVTVQAEVLDLLRDLQAERGMAMLLVTHNFGVVADLCDRVTVMQHGLFVESGPVRTILRTPEHPYTRSLLDSILDEGPARAPYGTTRKEARL
ncbi:dipeptide/oligopeptide/nickel ABC transporter permease/ATP-binding protein [Demequina sp. SYSU T00068]|uniref:dipeptide/oligopeptide/nickel ABC transporter permease/ATP-binding protein n=1 Tax=Demequina lignilytica TaxID=3051663 RepID=UPI00261369D7|nr:dipeptide/oligopeptide/nickel ABC transporter permease/ATP-binding protein [Demequina sp. SYSU T00068]MDN4490430.1 dipeptide/oligopeptide/nickel ABC transporter permease/ATP-binding protein [Demequina sp. SYSU T00068]